MVCPYSAQVVTVRAYLSSTLCIKLGTCLLILHFLCSQFRAPNYTILVRNIPQNLRSDIALYEHFGQLYGRERVEEAHCCLFLKDLEAMASKRWKSVANLEHAMAHLELKGEPATTSTHSLRNAATIGLQRQQSSIDSIDFYQNEVTELNQKISDHIDALEIKARRFLLTSAQKQLPFHRSRNLVDTDTETTTTTSTGLLPNESAGSENTMSAVVTLKQRPHIHVGSDEGRQALRTAATLSRQSSVKNVKKRFQQAKTTYKAALLMANNILRGVKDGTPDDAGFVTFNSLVAMHGALQSNQHPDFFALETEIAPDPGDINWGNVGKDREVLQSGRLISIVCTVTLCLFWTFIVSFVVGMADPDTIPQKYENIHQFLQENEWVANLLELLSPVLLLLLNSGLLPIILKAISRFEFPASDSLLEASAFWKMASFTVIQTF